MATDDPAGSILTQAERDRIRADMLFRDEIREEIATAAAAGTLVSRVRQTVLKSPVIATLVGGLLLNSFGVMKAHYDKKQAQEQAMLEKRIAIASQFAQDISHTISIEVFFSKHKLWLKEHRDDPDPRNETGMSRAEVNAQTFELWKLLMQAKPEKAIFSEVRSFFSDPKLPALLDAADHAIDQAQAATTPQERRSREADLDKILDDVMKTLEGEIGRPSR